MHDAHGNIIWWKVEGKSIMSIPQVPVTTTHPTGEE